MEKNYKETKQKYNSDKTFIQISKKLHIKLKEYCKINNIKIGIFIEKLISDNI